MARWFGDDPRIRADSDDIDETGLPMMAFLLGHLAEGTPGLRRISVTGRFLAGGVRDTMDSFLTHCRTAADIAQRLDLPDAVEAALPQAFERWDGHGVPGGVCGDTIIPGSAVSTPRCECRGRAVEPSSIPPWANCASATTGHRSTDSTLWNKPGPLTASEHERVRMVPSPTERVLARSPHLAALAGPASMVYERMDGSGYPRGLTGSMLPPAARILAAAQMFRALGEQRPHRPPLDPDERAEALRAEVTADRLDGDAAAAAQGRRPHKRARRRAARLPHHR